MTISEVLKKHPQIEADLLLGHVLHKGKEFLYLNGEKQLTIKQLNHFIDLAVKRKKGLPVAYLVGYKYFHGLKYKVTPDVLIPRPETEWLVDKVIEYCKEFNKSKPQAKILDVGTGSGAIAVNVAKYCKAKVFASDISSKALSVAKINAKANKAKVNFVKSDLFENVKGKFDIIIANLPYVPASDYKKLYKNLRHEPRLALTDGRDDFKLILKFLEQAKLHVTPDGVILLEVDPKTFKYLRPYKPQIFKDIHGLNRFAIIKF